MTRISSSLFFLFLCFQLNAQNILINPSFEDWDSKRFSKNCYLHLIIRDTSVVKGWFSMGTYSSSMIKCPQFDKLKKEHLYYGIIPKSGKRMGELCVNTRPSGNNSREYIAGTFSSTLVKNKTYHLTFFISPHDGCAYGVSQLGIFFTSRATPDSLFNNDFSITPQVTFSTEEIIEKGKWVRVDVEYKAKGEEKYFIIGNFLDDKKTTSILLGKDSPKANYWSFYVISNYLVDEFSLTPLDIEKDDSVPPTILPLVINKPFILKNIFFETDKSNLLPTSFAELASLVTFLDDHLESSIEIAGHTDNTGTEEKNQQLSEARAKAVADYLIVNGIIKQRISYKGYGSSIPIATNETEDGRQQNRRVEFTINNK